MLSNVSNSMESKIFPKHLIISTFIFSAVSWQLAIALIIVICSFDFIGFNNSTPITATCTELYFSNKFSAISLQIQTSLIGTILACILLTPIMIITIRWIIRICKAKVAYKQGTKKEILIILMLTFIAILSQIPICGYYLTFIVELKSCNSTYNIIHIYAVGIISTLLFISTFILWILFMVSYFQALKIQPQLDEQYTVTSPKHKHKAQINKNSLFSYKESQKRNKNREKNVQITEENMINSPYNNLKSEGSQYIPNSNFSNPQKSKKIMGESYKGQIRNTDGKQFHRQLNGYMNKYQSGAILPSYGIQQKNHQIYRDVSAYGPEREYKNQLKQKQIISNIRGKYGDY